MCNKIMLLRELGIYGATYIEKLIIYVLNILNYRIRIRTYIQDVRDYGANIGEELFDESFGVQEEYKSYQFMYACGRHL